MFYLSISSAKKQLSIFLELDELKK